MAPNFTTVVNKSASWSGTPFPLQLQQFTWKETPFKREVRCLSLNQCHFSAEAVTGFSLAHPLSCKLKNKQILNKNSSKSLNNHKGRFGDILVQIYKITIGIGTLFCPGQVLFYKIKCKYC